MRVAVASALAALVAVPAQAQLLPSFGAEAATDENRRGLSWSGGRGALSADVLMPLGAVEAGARVATLRGSPRHAGADAVADLELSTGWSLGGIALRGRATAHLFAGADRRMDYGEAALGASYGLGPFSVEAGARYAPDQAAIGGDNLHLYARAGAGIPLTGISVSAAVGRTTGGTDDPLRAARLRPGGDYTDWRIGVEHVTGPVTVGLDYVGNDIDRRRIGPSPYADARHVGDRLVARVRLGF